MAELKIEGMDELLKKLDEFGAKGKRIEGQAVKKAGQIVLDDAKATTEFTDRTGNLRDGLSMSGVKTKDGSKYVTVGIDRSDNSEIFYGKFLEFGTSKLPARPFLEPALEKNKNEILETIKNEIKRGLGL